LRKTLGLKDGDLVRVAVYTNRANEVQGGTRQPGIIHP